MLLAICFILGGLARAFVGTGYLSRWAVYPFIALICAFIGLYTVTDNIFAVCWAALIACHLGLGWTKWEKWKWMLGRFGLPALVLTVPLLYLGYISMASAGIYVVLSLLAGPVLSIKLTEFVSEILRGSETERRISYSLPIPSHSPTRVMVALSINGI